MSSSFPDFTGEDQQAASSQNECLSQSPIKGRLKKRQCIVSSSSTYEGSSSDENDENPPTQSPTVQPHNKSGVAMGRNTGVLDYHMKQAK